MRDAVAKAHILMEALPYIKEHAGKIVVVKYGGNAMQSDDMKEMITSDVVLMKFVGMKPVIIHGGGPEITKYMRKKGKEVKFVEGLRVTDRETMEIVREVLVEKVNKNIVELINRHTLPSFGPTKLAVGVIGDSEGLISVNKKKASVDLGFVGEVESVKPSILIELINEDYIPVVASLGLGSNGASYNVNADTVAGQIASALEADKIIFLTDVAGLYKDFQDKNSLISELSLDECEDMIDKKAMSHGMLPKVEGCMNALKGGVERAHILDGTLPHALLLEVFTREGVGTMITKS